MRLPAAATAAAATTTTAARTATAGRTFLRFVDAKRATAHILAVQRLNGTRGIRTRHFDKAEATRTARFAIVDERDGFHGAMGLKQLTHLAFVGRERQVTN